MIARNEAFPSITLQPAPFIVSSSTTTQPFSSSVKILDLAVLIRQPSVVKREYRTGDSRALPQVQSSFFAIISNCLKMLGWTLVCFPMAAIVVLQVTFKDMKVFICYRWLVYIGSQNIVEAPYRPVCQIAEDLLLFLFELECQMKYNANQHVFDDPQKTRLWPKHLAIRVL